MRYVAVLTSLLLALALASQGTAADFKTLRRLAAGVPTNPPPLPPGQSVRAVQFLKMVMHPAAGEAWAVTYESIPFQHDNNPNPAYEMLTWREGRVEAETASFARAFEDELQKAGFKTEASSSLFGGEDGSADLKVAVLVDDLKGRFCIDCPNLFNAKAVPATVLMTAHWEVYSALDRKVVAKITTSGGADSMKRVRDSVVPAVLDAFRENARQLIASPDFRNVVTTSVTASVAAPPASPALAPITVAVGPGPTTLAQASNSVAVVYAADGSGSGFLISQDGYLLTNHHVVGGSKFVKLKWSDGSEALGEVIRSDARRDVALVKTDAKGRLGIFARVGQVEPGEPVFAVGTPLDDKLQNTLTKGIVSANRVYEGQPFIQSDVAVTHGNSGGPLLDEKARLVGLTVSGRAPGGAPVGLNFFIPIDDAFRVLALTVKAASVTPPPRRK